MWCVAPRWPAHGRHVAVEFVHPVIVGKRALPAVHVDGRRRRPRPCASWPGPATCCWSSGRPTTTRPSTCCDGPRPGASPGSGSGPAPAHRPARRSTSSGGATSTRTAAARSGDLVLLYHLLWELTHVVFEHPGLLAAGAGRAPTRCASPAADEGEVAEVRAMRRRRPGRRGGRRSPETPSTSAWSDAVVARRPPPGARRGGAHHVARERTRRA